MLHFHKPLCGGRFIMWQMLVKWCAKFGSRDWNKHTHLNNRSLNTSIVLGQPGTPNPFQLFGFSRRGPVESSRPDSCWLTLLLSFFSYQLYTIPNCFHIFKHSGDSLSGDYKRRLCDQQDGRRHQKWEITAVCLARGSNPQSADKKPPLKGSKNENMEDSSWQIWQGSSSCVTHV